MIYFLGLILALLPSYLIRLKISSIPTTFLELLIVVFLFATVVTLKNKDLAKIRALGKINYAIILFVLAGIIATIVAPEKAKALGQLKAFIIEPVLLFYAVLITVRSKTELNIALKGLFIGTGLISLFGLVQYLTYNHLPLRYWGNGTEIERITSVFDYPNALALFLAPLIGFFTALWVNEYPLFKNRWVWFACLVIMGFGLLLTFSRGAFIALAIGLFLVLLQKYKAKKVVLPSIILIALLALVPGVHQRLGLGISDPSSEAHFGLMRAGIQQITDNPVFGNGLAGFARLNLGVEYPHNIVLNFWVQMGILGLIAFVWIAALVLQRYKKNPQPLTLAAGVFMLILILHGLVDVPYFKNDLAVLFWFVVAASYI